MSLRRFAALVALKFSSKSFDLVTFLQPQQTVFWSDRTLIQRAERLESDQLLFHPRLKNGCRVIIRDRQQTHNSVCVCASVCVCVCCFDECVSFLTHRSVSSLVLWTFLQNTEAPPGWVLFSTPSGCGKLLVGFMRRTLMMKKGDDEDEVLPPQPESAALMWFALER